MTVAGDPLRQAGQPPNGSLPPGNGLLSAETRGRTRVLRLAGDLDLFSAEVLRRELEQALPDGSAPVVVDLRDVTFLDSTVLGLLLLAGRRVEERGGRLTLASAGAPVDRVLEVSGLGVFLPSYPTLEEALAERPGR